MRGFFLFRYVGNRYLVPYKNKKEVNENTKDLGFPTWIIYPLAICKIAAVAVRNLKQ